MRVQNMATLIGPVPVQLASNYKLLTNARKLPQHVRPAAATDVAHSQPRMFLRPLMMIAPGSRPPSSARTTTNSTESMDFRAHNLD
jgi:hypothetical protein